MKNSVYSVSRLTVKSETIQIIIPAGTTLTKFQLPDQQNLRNTFIMDIEAYYAEILPKSILTGDAIIPLALMKSIFFTLQSYNGKNFVWQRPLIDYKYKNTFSIDPSDFQNFNLTRFNGQRINYPKSYIEIADPTLVSPTVRQVVFLNIYYRETDKTAEKDKGATFRNRS
jgi:hypothetical protein